MRFLKLSLFVVACGALLPAGGCGWMLDALYILPQVADIFSSLGGAAT